MFDFNQPLHARRFMLIEYRKKAILSTLPFDWKVQKPEIGAVLLQEYCDFDLIRFICFVFCRCANLWNKYSKKASVLAPMPLLSERTNEICWKGHYFLRLKLTADKNRFQQKFIISSENQVGLYERTYSKAINESNDAGRSCLLLF